MLGTPARAVRAEVPQEGSTMDDLPQAEHCAQMLAALASPVRLRIVRLLCADQRTAPEIAELLGISLANAAHHLGRLREAGLIRARQEGRSTFYGLSQETGSD